MMMNVADGCCLGDDGDGDGISKTVEFSHRTQNGGISSDVCSIYFTYLFPIISILSVRFSVLIVVVVVVVLDNIEHSIFYQFRLI